MFYVIERRLDTKKNWAMSVKGAFPTEKLAVTYMQANYIPAHEGVDIRDWVSMSDDGKPIEAVIVFLPYNKP
jgi:hypothetical protein